MSTSCQQMCAPGEVTTQHFDPLKCKSEIPKFLHCVTEGGKMWSMCIANDNNFRQCITRGMLQ
jgi:hypothetical protein